MTPELDPLAVPASETNTDFPLLKPDKIYRFSVRSISLEDAKSDKAPQGAKNLVIKLVTTKDELDTNGNTVHSGFPLTKWIPTYAAGQRTVAQAAQDIASFIKAVEGEKAKTTPRQLMDNPTMYDNKLVDGKVSINKDKSGQFNDSNGVRFVALK